MAGVEEQVGIRRGADDRRAVGRHRSQAGPEAGARQVAAGEQVGDHALQRLAPARIQAQVEAAELGHAADADAIVEARDGDLVGFVEHGGLRRRGRVKQRDRQRIALDRVDRDAEPEPGREVARKAAEGEHVAVGSEHFARRAAQAHAGDAAAFGDQAFDALAEAEIHAQPARDVGQRAREQVAVTGFVVRQAQAAGQQVARARERRFDRRQLAAVEQLVGHAALFEHGDVALHAVELRLRAKELQRALGAVLVADAGVGAQRAQAVAAVFGHAHHAFLVDRVALGRAVLQHRRHPAQLEQRSVGPDRERRMLLEHPLQRLEGNARRGPGRGIAGRHLAGVGEAGFFRGAALPIDERHFRAGTRQVVRTRDTDDTAAQNDHFHGKTPSLQEKSQAYSLVCHKLH